MKYSYSRYLFFFGIAIWQSINKEIRLREQEMQIKHEKSLEDAKKQYMVEGVKKIQSLIRGFHGFVQHILSGKYRNDHDALIASAEVLHRDHTRIEHVLQEFLELSKTETITYHKEETELTGVVKEAIHFVSGLLSQKKLHISLSVQPVRSVMIDREKVFYAIVNLIDNAGKRSKKGLIRVIVEEKDGSAFVRVQDEGCGFAKHELDRLFLGEFRHDGERGIGLALFMVKLVVEAHKGVVFGQSAGIHKGAEFGFSIPYHNV